MPFSDARLLNVLVAHVLVPAQRGFLSRHAQPAGEETEPFYHDYKVIVAAGNAAGIGVAALPPVQEAMDDPLKTKTITLSCGKLTTGVTVKPWTGILMLRNSSTPETYFQAAFRVQSPWTIRNPDGDVAEQRTDHQGRVLRLRLCSGPGVAADRGLQLPVERRRDKPGKEGGGVHQLPACSRLRRQFHEAD